MLVAVSFKCFICWKPCPFDQTFPAVFITQGKLFIHEFQDKLQLFLGSLLLTDLGDL